MFKYKFGHAVVKYHIPILIIALLLLIPSVFGIINTRVNYDLLTYLPEDMDSMKGQDIFMEDFGKGAFSLVIVEGMDDADVANLEAEIEQVDHVDSVLWYDDVLDSQTIPMEAIPEKYYDDFNSGDATMMAVFYDTSTSADETMEAVTQIRNLSNDQVYVSGLSALVTDLKSLAEREEPKYVAIAVLCAVVMLLLLTDSWLVPFIFLASIGMAIAYNMGSNWFLGDISYVTKAIAAVLQLAVTMDYSIFLWHAFVEQHQIYPDDSKKAMEIAIGDTFVAIFSSSLTACAGFLALVFMTYTLGADLGIVMAKGCILGVIGSLTTLPALILIFEKPLLKTQHHTLIPRADRLSRFVTRHYWAMLIVFIVVLFPATYGFFNKPVYYDFTNILTGEDVASINEDDMKFLIANQKVEDEFDVATTEVILCDSDMPHAQAKEMLNRLEDVDGVKTVLGYDSLVGGQVPDEVIPSDIRDTLKDGDYQLILVNSSYAVSTDECNDQIDQIDSIIKDYDPDAMLIGEAPATKDLISTTDHDAKVVDAIAIIAIIIILIVVFGSVTLPFILVLVIEFAVMINLGIPYYTGAAMPFIAPVCISTIQLGSTVNYAILETTRYRAERHSGKAKLDAVSIAMATSLPSVVSSAMSFFAATFGVAVYSNISLISSMTELMARGAVVSMLAVLFILPAFFMVFDKVIIKTSRGFIDKGGNGPKGGAPAGATPRGSAPAGELAEGGVYGGADSPNAANAPVEIVPAGGLHAGHGIAGGLTGDVSRSGGGMGAPERSGTGFPATVLAGGVLPSLRASRFATRMAGCRVVARRRNADGKREISGGCFNPMSIMEVTA